MITGKKILTISFVITVISLAAVSSQSLRDKQYTIPHLFLNFFFIISMISSTTGFLAEKQKQDNNKTEKILS